MNYKEHTILIVDDEQDILDLIKFNVENLGFKTVTADNGESAITNARTKNPNLIILDLMLPGIDGLDVCKLLKQDENTEHIPILMLTAKGEESDIVRGLEIGADDYVTKPFSLKVLLARINTLLKRRIDRENNVKDYLIFDNLKIHPGKHEVTVDKKKIDLTFMEFQILFLLASHPNWVYTRNQIINEIRGDDYIVTDRAIDFQIVGLRKKLGAAKNFIKTVRGIGYRFVIEN